MKRVWKCRAQLRNLFGFNRGATCRGRWDESEPQRRSHAFDLRHCHAFERSCGGIVLMRRLTFKLVIIVITVAVVVVVVVVAEVAIKTITHIVVVVFINRVTTTTTRTLPTDTVAPNIIFFVVVVINSTSADAMRGTRCQAALFRRRRWWCS
jgi:hypothetical protein